MNNVKAGALNTVADRVSYIRKLTGLDRNVVAKRYHFGISSLEKWENGRSHPTERSLKRVINMALAHSIECTPEWILHGEGPPPKIITPSSLSKDLISENHTTEGILRDLHYFKTLYPEGLTLMVSDDAMADYYVNGDFVGGLPVDLGKLKQYLSYACIVQTADGKTRLRRIGHEDGSWFLYGTNTRHNGWPYLEKDVNLTKAAPVFWHRLKL